MIKRFHTFHHINEAKYQTFNLDALKSKLETFRKNMEDENEWEDYKECFRGTCQDVTNQLVKYLKDEGYKATRTRGYYSDAGDEYYPDTSDWDFDDVEEFGDKYANNGDSANGLEFPHWWVEVDKYIVDLTEDQFHPGEEDEYRIGVYTKPDPSYNKG